MLLAQRPGRGGYVLTVLVIVPRAAGRVRGQILRECMSTGDRRGIVGSGALGTRRILGGGGLCPGRVERLAAREVRRPYSVFRRSRWGSGYPPVAERELVRTCTQISGNLLSTVVALLSSGRPRRSEDSREGCSGEVTCAVVNSSGRRHTHT